MDQHLLGHLSFEESAAELNPKEVENLKLLVSKMETVEPHITKVIIEATGTGTGTFEKNIDFSRRRAVSVAREMIEMGVPAERLIVAGYGNVCAEAWKADADDVNNIATIISLETVCGGVRYYGCCDHRTPGNV
jgi:outer membrane protein OmpA-like peptidoglycan-associated protein